MSFSKVLQLVDYLSYRNVFVVVIVTVVGFSSCVGIRLVVRCGLDVIGQQWLHLVWQGQGVIRWAE